MSGNLNLLKVPIPGRVWSQFPDQFKSTYKSREAIGLKNTCACGSCSVFDPPTTCAGKDWTMDWDICCGLACRQTRVCVPPQTHFCWLSASGEETTKAEFEELSEDPDKPPVLNCFYDDSKMTPESLKNWRLRFGKTSNYFEIFAQLATTATSQNKCLGRECMANDEECKAKSKICSRLSEDSAFGIDLRSEWKFLSKEERLELIKTICSRLKNATDCLCENRALDPKYGELKRIHSFEDDCWYIPCVDPYSLNNAVDPASKKTCPQNMCQVIIDALGGNAVTIKDNTANINCKFPSPTLGPTPTPTSGPKPTTTSGPTPTPTPTPTLPPSPTATPGPIRPTPWPPVPQKSNTSAGVFVAVAVIVIAVAIVAFMSGAAP